MMAAKTKSGTPAKMSAAEVRKAYEAAQEKLQKLQEYGYCYMCDTHKSRDKFYVSTDPLISSGITPICKECAKKIALRIDKNGEEHTPTKESCQKALEYLNKPFLNIVWNASVQESESLLAGNVKHNAWASYVKNIAMVNYVGLTYKDSDMFKEKIIYEDEITEEQIIAEHSGLDTYDSFIKNKEDVIRLLNYDPFEKESVSDQPFLYSQLLGLLDTSEDANDDMMRTSSAISIVRSFLQASKIDNTIAVLMADIKNTEKNSATIRSLQESKAKIMTTISKLAEDSCISLRYNKNSKKGENTWTGKTKRIKDLNLREGEVNGFDMATCKGMQQVQEMSDASIMKQLNLDESEWSDMVAEMRVTNGNLRKERDSYKEINRIILRENLDLKALIADKNIDISQDIVNLNDLYSVFADEAEETIVIDDENVTQKTEVISDG